MPALSASGVRRLMDPLGSSVSRQLATVDRERCSIVSVVVSDECQA